MRSPALSKAKRAITIKVSADGNSGASGQTLDTTLLGKEVRESQRKSKAWSVKGGGQRDFPDCAGSQGHNQAWCMIGGISAEDYRRNCLAHQHRPP